MPKKRKGLLPFLWNAWLWIATGFLHLIYLSAKAIARFGISIFQRAFAKAKEHAGRSSPPKAIASYSPFTLQLSLAGDLQEFELQLLSRPSLIGLILGARGSGKSALGMRILENIYAKTGRKVCAMGFLPNALPGWIIHVTSVEQIPNNSFALVDEGGIEFSSRSSFSSANRLLSALLFASRHKGISALFISQNSANLELNAIRQSDYLLLRKPSLLQQEFERKKIGEIYSGISAHYPKLPDSGRYSTYMHSDWFRGFAANRLPGFWSERASKSYAGRRLGQS